ncbi:MAG: ESPR-type extended signal peptide-containing protein, partial [Veillonella sp.]|nr:ESPR-type extended signal peptide-containing protein [Veillonella sp.]
MGLNHIYKVIWSKTKNAWVVVSEIAKQDGKSSVKSVVTSLAGKSVAAVMVAMVMCGGVAFAGAGTELGGGTATKSSSIAIGTSWAFEDDGIAIGQSAQAKDRVSIAIGRDSLAKDQRGIAVGYKTVTESGISIGDQSSSTSHGMAIGQFAKSLGSAIVLGDNSSGRDEAVVIGNASRGDGSRSVTVGRNNSNYGDFSTLVGYNSTIGNSNARSILVGADSSITNSSYVTAVGNEINVGSGYNFAAVLGYQSATSAYTNPTDTTVSGVTLDASQYAGKGTTLGQGAILSIGDTNKERQIKNVAAGVISATSTDAINGSQLYEAVRAVTASASPDVYMHVNDGTTTQGAGNATTNLGKANEKGGATGNRSIAIGVGSQASGQNSVVIGSEVKSTSANIVAIGNPAASWSAIGTNSMGATLIGYNSVISNNSASSSVFGSNSSVLGTSSVAINNASVNGTNSVAINGKAGRFQGINQFTSNNAVAINGVAKGNNNIAIGGSVGYSNVGDSYLVSGSNFSTPSENSIAIGNNTLVTQKNTVMVGTYDKEYTAKANIDKNKVITPALHTAYYTLGAVDKQYYEGTLNNSVYLGHESYAFTPDALVDDESHLTGEQSIHTKKYDATGNIVVSNNTTGGAFGKVSKATINGDEITGFAGAQSVGAVTIGAGDYERRIQNVAAGEVSATSTDGINGSQLYAVANTLSKNMSSYMHINDGTSTQTVGNATTNYGYSGSKAGATGNLAIAGGMNAKASGQQSLSLGSYTKSEGDYSVVIGSSHDTSWSTYGRGQTFALGNYSVVLGRGAQTHKDNSIAIGHRAEVQGEDSIGIGKYVFTGGYGSGLTDSSSGITAVGIKLGVNGKNTNVFGQGNIDNIGGGNPIRANDSTILGNRNGVDSLDSNGQSILPSSINDYATGSHILGNDNLVSGNNAIAIGNKIRVYQNSVALGYYAMATKNKSIAVGYGATANGENSISIGTGNVVEGAKSSAIGDPSYIDTTATGTHVHGNDNGTATNPIKASESTFMGNTNLAGTAGTTGIHVVGNNNSVDSSNVMVVGNGVNVGTGLDGAVVLGNASSADQYAAATDSTINGVTFEAAGYAGNTGLNKGSIVSVGATGVERQIKNVAAGAVTATSTDAVNGSQLYKTAETILKMPINMAGDSGDTVGLKLGKTVNIKGSVTSGADVTDGNIAVVGDKTTSTLSLKMAKNLTGLTSGTFTDATGNQTVINGAGVTVTPTGTGATPISITTSGINAGNQEIKGVKKGTTDDAAVNKKQMDDALAGISSTLTINDGTTDGSVNIKTGKLKVVGE